MTTETLMTEAATTTEGEAASQPATEQPATGAGEGGQQQQATESQQQVEDTKTEGDGEEQKPEGAPEKYEFQAPEGQEFSPEVIGAFSEVAKELNLTQADAQKVIDKIAPAMAERQANAIEQARSQWAESAKTDGEFGGDKLPENLAVAKKALDQFGTPELRDLLEQSGLGNHPEIIRVLYRAGKAISEDRVVSGQLASGQADPAKRLFPNQA
ncbi:MAG: protease [Proteobacteria bacterium]|nr:MAG: protease [Pseudomonadota bacterium]